MSVSGQTPSALLCECATSLDAHRMRFQKHERLHLPCGTLATDASNRLGLGQALVVIQILQQIEERCFLALVVHLLGVNPPGMCGVSKSSTQHGVAAWEHFLRIFRPRHDGILGDARAQHCCAKRIVLQLGLHPIEPLGERLERTRAGVHTYGLDTPRPSSEKQNREGERDRALCS